MRQKYKSWLVVTKILALLIVGCRKNVTTQCNLIVTIANDTNRQLSQITQVDRSSSVQDSQSWSRAITIFDQAAAQLKALQIQDEQLLVYQRELAELWQTYALTTNDAIDARAIKSLATLTKANNDTQVADQKLLAITKQLNSYCGE